MRKAWENYKRMIRDYPVVVRYTLEALGEVLAGLFYMTLPVTFIVAYPIYLAARKLRNA
jgi:hypothetical protein